MSEGAEIGLAGNKEVDVASLPPGPASSEFGSVDSIRDKESSPLASVKEPELDRAIQLLSEILNFSYETTLISVATTNVSKSANTLIHGQ